MGGSGGREPWVWSLLTAEGCWLGHCSKGAGRCPKGGYCDHQGPPSRVGGQSLSLPAFPLPCCSVSQPGILVRIIGDSETPPMPCPTPRDPDASDWIGLVQGFPGGASGKEPACQCRRFERYRFCLWVGRIPWRRAWQPTPVFLPGESHGQRSLAGCCPWGHTELDTSEQLNTHAQVIATRSRGQRAAALGGPETWVPVQRLSPQKAPLRPSWDYLITPSATRYHESVKCPGLC